MENTEETLGHGKEVLGGGGSGGSGGAGGSSPGSTLVLLSVPGTAPGTPAAATAAKVGKIKVLSHKVKRRQATLVVQVPAAGTLSTAGHGVRAVHRQASRAEKVTVHLALTGAGISALRRHHVMRVPLKVSFAPVSGAKSSASVALQFR